MKTIYYLTDQPKTEIFDGPFYTRDEAESAHRHALRRGMSVIICKKSEIRHLTRNLADEHYDKDGNPRRENEG